MAPIPRCELRIPGESIAKRIDTTPKPTTKPIQKSGKSTNTTVKVTSFTVKGGPNKSVNDNSNTKSNKDDEECPAEQSGTVNGPKNPQPAHSANTRDSAQILEQDVPANLKPAHSEHTRDSAQILETDVSADLNIPEPAHSKSTRDSAQILEDAESFSAALTRDMVEVREHQKAEGEDPECMGMTACEILEKCRADTEAAEASGELETMKCPSLSTLGTPGDVCAKFCHDRNSPFPEGGKVKKKKKKPKNRYCEKWDKHPNRFHTCKGMNIKQTESAGPPAKVCLGTYKSGETYTTFWGSSQAVNLRKKMDRQMRKKRQLLERKHEKEFIRRQKMRRRAKEKRKMLKYRDQTKIPQGEDNLRINKAYDLRFNFNKQLPSMPMTMKKHFDKFKKPPFKNFIAGKVRKCNKEIDEFDKLRLPVEKK